MISRSMLTAYLPYNIYIVHSLSGVVHTRSESPQDELRVVQTCKITLASAYVLHHLSAV